MVSSIKIRLLLTRMQMHSTETVIMTCAVEHYPVAMDEETGLLRTRQWKIHVMQNSMGLAICEIKTP